MHHGIHGLVFSGPFATLGECTFHFSHPDEGVKDSILDSGTVPEYLGNIQGVSFPVKIAFKWFSFTA